MDRDLLERARAEQLPMPRAVEMGVFCGLGEGLVDYAAVSRVLREVGYNGFGIVEQDMFPVPFDAPLPIARRSREYLREIGMG